MVQKRTGIVVICFVLLIGITFGGSFLFKEVCLANKISSDRSRMLVVFTDENLLTHYYLDAPTQSSPTLLYKKQITDYPSALWIQEKNILLFTTKDANGHTQLFQFDRFTKKRKQLTKEFHSVDTLRFDQKRGKVYMRVLLPGHRNFHLATYDLNTHQTDVWNPSEDDQSVVYFDYNALHNQIVTLTQSVIEEYEKVSRANETQTPLEPSIKQINLIAIDSKKSKRIGTIKKFIRDLSISPEGTDILFTASDEFTPNAKKTMYQLEMMNGKYTPLLSDSASFSKLDLAQYAPDGKSIYFLAIPMPSKWFMDQGGREIKIRAIYRYNLETKTVSKIWYKEGGYINHFLLLQ